MAPATRLHSGHNKRRALPNIIANVQFSCTGKSAGNNSPQTSQNVGAGPAKPVR